MFVYVFFYDLLTCITRMHNMRIVRIPSSGAVGHYYLLSAYPNNTMSIFTNLMSKNTTTCSRVFQDAARAPPPPSVKDNLRPRANKYTPPPQEKMHRPSGAVDSVSPPSPPLLPSPMDWLGRMGQNLGLMKPVKKPEKPSKAPVSSPLDDDSEDAGARPTPSDEYNRPRSSILPASAGAVSRPLNHGDDMYGAKHGGYTRNRASRDGAEDRYDDDDDDGRGDSYDDKYRRESADRRSMPPRASADRQRTIRSPLDEYNDDDVGRGRKGVARTNGGAWKDSAGAGVGTRRRRIASPLDDYDDDDDY
jgi:hypothetical protein